MKQRIIRAAEWTVLLPVWREAAQATWIRVTGASFVGFLWFILIMGIIGVAAGGGDEGKPNVRDARTASPARTEKPTPRRTSTPRLTRSPTPAPTLTQNPTPQTTPQLTPGPTAAPTAAPPPAGPRTTFSDGTYVVGSEVSAGTYRNSSSSSGCYWERLSGFGGTTDEIIANNFTQSRQLVTISPSDVGFSAQGCGTWTQDLSPITSDPSAPFGDGMYQVGSEVAPGTWRNDGTSGCYWARLSGFSHETYHIITNNFGDEQQIVTVGAGDAGFESSGCGTWTNIQ